MHDAREILVWFLGKALAEKRERLCQFASKHRTQDKFLAELSHAFGGYVKRPVLVPELPESAWSAPGFAFGGGEEFGARFDSLREAWERVDRYQGVLVVSADGRYGVWCDHEVWDERICVALASGIA